LGAKNGAALNKDTKGTQLSRCVGEIEIPFHIIKFANVNLLSNSDSQAGEWRRISILSHCLGGNVIRVPPVRHTGEEKEFG